MQVRDNLKKIKEKGNGERERETRKYAKGKRNYRNSMGAKGDFI